MDELTNQFFGGSDIQHLGEYYPIMNIHIQLAHEPKMPIYGLPFPIQGYQ